MNQAAPDPAGRALVWASTSFTVLALAMIVGPYIGEHLLTRSIANPDQAFRAEAAFGATFGLQRFFAASTGEDYRERLRSCRPHLRDRC